MKYYFASFLLLLCLASTFFYVATEGTTSPSAQETKPIVASEPNKAKLVLVAPTSARIGELVRLDVSESNAVTYRWLLVPDSVDFLVFDSGERAVFSGREAGEYQIIVGCAVDGSVDFVVHTIKVIGPPAIPADGDLEALIPYWIWHNPFPENEREALADSFEAIADQGDKLQESTDWIEATADANRKVLGERIDAWDVILDKIGAELSKKALTGELTTPEDHKRAWMEIAEGLRSC